MVFDPQAFISSGSAAASMPGTSPTEDPAPLPAMPAVAAAPPKGFDPQRFINGGKAVDQNTATDIPLAFSGNTPETAMNKNGLSMTDRMNLALGNPKGNIAYLKEKYPDAQVVKEPGT